jgi:nucleoside-diphosphate-sugar epimerase
VPEALILGGTGQIGRATASRLLADGWGVTLAARDPDGMPTELAGEAAFVQVDRAETASLEAALGDGVDLLVDCVAFTADDAEQLIALGDRLGSVVAISSASVYRDEENRTFDEATGSDDFPRFPVPITERHPTVAPGDATYSTRKMAMEGALLDSDLRATVVRPCAIHGVGTRFSREWHFVKRVLDGRRVVVLAHRGESRFHTTATENLAELIALAARRPTRRVVNCGDPDTPSVARIARTVAEALEHEWSTVLLPGDPPSAALDNPWGVARPVIVDMAAAEIDLAYRPVTTYERAVAPTCRWLVESVAGRDWRDVLPGSARHMGEGFDYAAEDEFLRGLAD